MVVSSVKLTLPNMRVQDDIRLCLGFLVDYLGKHGSDQQLPPAMLFPFRKLNPKKQR